MPMTLQPIPHPEGHTCPRCGKPSLWYRGDEIRTRHPAFDTTRDWCESCLRERNDRQAEQLQRKLFPPVRHEE